ncbi:LLM class flavin-dependent oxidoreductase [Agreia sp. COWG]|uniref:LLM class flavin-dependent oxidoreductase n=1 Tax=Agreia sp. COWG TaxID=2773266 RepID=UPI0019289C3E|nr:LLM class flavin-dependent oxidoreductase [Agreia sp. COWG]CAD6003220.1 Luciferase [Agreia sp. COWG]
MKLSVLDLLPVRTNQTTADSVASAVSLAQCAERLGFTRFWVAEHHNMEAVAATAPPVLMAHIAANTSRIRLGSGGVMLPNHAPLTVAEQFSLLEAMHPGRIDLGIGRAPGSDPVTAYMLRGPRTEDSPVDTFPDDVETVAALLGSDDTPITDPFDREQQPGVVIPLRGRQYALRSTPRASSSPRVWLLGSSTYSAQLAAKLGLAFVYAHHFGQPGIESALAVYRREFQPSQALAAPLTFLTDNAVVAETHEEAMALALPQLITMARLRSGGALGPQLTVEEAKAETLNPMEEDLMADQLERWIVGTPDVAAERIRRLTERYEVDEVMVSAVASGYADEDRRENRGKQRTLELLARELLPQTAEV